MRDLIDNQAELDSEEDDESFDDEAGDRPRKERDGRIEDSSDEEEDDDTQTKKSKKPTPRLVLVPVDADGKDIIRTAQLGGLKDMPTGGEAMTGGPLGPRQC